VLRLEQINVSYGDVPVLWNLSLKIEQGEIVTVIGPNGAGKSTLLRAIVNLTPAVKTGRPEEGIFYRSRRTEGIPPEEMIHLGIVLVPEGARVFPEMTVLNNLKMGSYIPKARAFREETLGEVYTLFPVLKERQFQKAGSLSGGERQMLALGTALMSKPDLLLLDEPSLGLQPVLVTRTFEAIRTINRKGVTILLVEQNVNYSLALSDRAYVIENGRIVLEGRGKELLENPHVKKAYLAM
jgi:branched-chain amino acid transport system ATP-binding protein